MNDYKEPNERLASIAKEMEDLSEDRDYEKTHGYADALLCEALTVLLGGHPTVERILRAYDKLEKWYA